MKETIHQPTTNLPYYEHLHDALADLVGKSASATKLKWQKRAISGGCIHDSAIFHLDNDNAFFVKQNTADNFPSLSHEADGLLALKTANCIPCATPLALGVNKEENNAFLVLEVIHSRDKKPDFWVDFARRLATLHTSTDNAYFGWQHRHTHHRIAKRNVPHNDWIEFFAQARLQPQLELARQALGNTLFAKGRQLIDKLDSFIEAPPHPQLIHGDLWSGNYMVGHDGHAVLIDPAVYYGHGEADLAMTHLFGRFPSSFYAAYQEINPLSDNYQQHADIYNLFHLLNHLNLFGQGYLASVKNIIERYG